MQLISFNIFRTLDIPAARYLKPELLFRSLEAVKQADWVLFPEYWQVNALVYGLHKNIFPSPATYHLGHDKVEQTRAFWAVCPEHVPTTEILAATEANIVGVLERFEFPFVAKEVRNSMGRGVYLINSRREFLEYAAENPVLYVQERLPIERDLRIVWIGEQVVDAYWRVAAEGSFLNNVACGATVCRDDVPDEALELVRRVALELGIDHAGFDVAVVNGHLYFLEFNVFFGNQGLAQRGVKPGSLILDYLNRRADSPKKSPSVAA